MKKVFLLGLAYLLFISCASETTKTITTPPSPVFSGYRITDAASSSNNTSVITSQTIINGTLQNDKFYSETSEVIYNGVSQGVFTDQYYFYVNNLLDHRIGGTGTTYFYYDSNNQLIGATKVSSSGNLNERYVYNANNIVYCESINLPYNDANAVVSHRNILQFDANNEVITAGPDSNLDGIMDTVNNFSYANDNLMSISYYNGTVQTFDYSTVIDNLNLITQNSYGKKVTRLICSDSFRGLTYDLKYSKNILTQDMPLANYQVLPTYYYQTKTVTQNINNPQSGYQGIDTNTTQFFFN